jgi:signal peptide peptidase SppA
VAFIRDTAVPAVRGWVTGKHAPVVPVVPLKGVIGQAGLGRQGLSLEGLAGVLHRAFSIKRAAAVALIINSPGGSPVQSSLIAKRLRQLADENDLKILAFCEDVAASGGYWLAASADEIFVDDSSIVGSIGVISSGFGLKGAIKKLGIERRLYTAGENKSFLDPFLDEKKVDVDRLKSIQLELHDTFKTYVAERRGEKLADDPELFTGAFWTGKHAVDLGLADAVGEVRSTLRERFGEDVRTPVIKPKKSWFSSKLPSGQAFGSEAATAAIASVEERLMWGPVSLLDLLSLNEIVREKVCSAFRSQKYSSLAAAIFVVWKGFGYLQRRQKIQDAEKYEKVRKSRAERQGTPDPVEDMTQCPTCNTFVAGPSPKSCGKSGCPYGV